MQVVSQFQKTVWCIFETVLKVDDVPWLQKGLGKK